MALDGAANQANKATSARTGPADIVDRLLDFPNHRGMNAICALRQEAADEIRALRNKVQPERSDSRECPIVGGGPNQPVSLGQENVAFTSRLAVGAHP